MSNRLRLLLACLATAVIVVPLGWLWWSSLLPGEYSVMDMGYVDLGGGPDPGGAMGSPAHAGMAHSAAGTSADGHPAAEGDGRGGAVDISTLVGETRGTPDVRLDLTAREERFRLASGREVSGYTLNGHSPGPTLHARQGDLVEVRLTNADVQGGITLHWHGIDVPNAMDGVAGVTQDAVEPGETYTYRFVAQQVGTYWYHSHQVSHVQVRRGLFGAVVVEPPGGPPPGTVDVTALSHLYDGVSTVNGHEGDLRVPAEPGTVARVRLVNTDNGPMTVWVSGAGYRVLAVDGTDLNRPGEVSGKALVVTAGGRADLEVVVPPGGARVELGGDAVVLGPAGASPARTSAPRALVDLLTYGEPARTGIDPSKADRRFEYAIGRRPGFLDGRPGLFWTINGHLWPDVPMFTVARGDVVRFRIVNHTSDVHPMHLHGHHALVLSRDGKPSTGSPWWVDSLNVLPGESYEIAFVADNPGVWMDHCHNLPHATEGLVAHLMYAGYTTPFKVGGEDHNEPE